MGFGLSEQDNISIPVLTFSKSTRQPEITCPGALCGAGVRQDHPDLPVCVWRPLADAGPTLPQERHTGRLAWTWVPETPAQPTWSQKRCALVPRNTAGHYSNIT